MALPFFYLDNLDTAQSSLTLDEDTSKHVVNVLRMKIGEQLHLTDGKGNLMVAEITDDHKKKCVVTALAVKFEHPPQRKVSIAISLLKNANRFEWFLEKATELGISEIIPLICERTEKSSFRYDRMKNILVSAMLQSQQSWLPVLHQSTPFEQLLEQEDSSSTTQKFIAHCIPGQKTNLAILFSPSHSSHIILIGPEGDFTNEEAALAVQHNFLPVALGETRLRSETAGMVAATILKVIS
jgi:16S rRNA (uracil1498-N3)-methyltransferase